ncbi:MAG: transposase [Desulfarculus sp.]|nr:transposase [Desulfarculus sp.]
MEFIAIDVETANADMSSLCQIGIACYKGGQLVDEWKTYLNPEDFFDEINIEIHGIDEDTVKNSPTFPHVTSNVYGYLDGKIAVCHTHFDRVALSQVCLKYDLRPPKCTWLDTARVARRAWQKFARKGYGLHNVCNSLGYQFQHHDALEDAKAAAHILLSASKDAGIDVQNWLVRVQQPIEPRKLSEPIAREGNPDADFFGEVMVFTGALSIPRREAANLAATYGFSVDSGVTKKTTIIVVGDQDIKRLAGHEKSLKHRKAEELIKNGQPIKILRETDFMALVKSM